MSRRVSWRRYEHLRREGFVDLDAVDLAQLHRGFVERFMNCGDGADAHARRVDADAGPARELTQRREAVHGDGGFAREDERARTVADARGRGGGDDAALLERRRQRAHLLEARLPRMLVDLEGDDSPPALELNRQDLVDEHARSARGGPPLLRLDRVGVRVGA